MLLWKNFLCWKRIFNYSMEFKLVANLWKKGTEEKMRTINFIVLYQNLYVCKVSSHSTFKNFYAFFLPLKFQLQNESEENLNKSHLQLKFGYYFMEKNYFSIEKLMANFVIFLCNVRNLKSCWNNRFDCVEEYYIL